MDRKSLIRDIFAPSNLWTLAQWLFPAGTAVVSAWLSSLFQLPPSVTLGLALVSAACVLLLLTEIRKITAAGKISIMAVPCHQYILEGDGCAVQMKVTFFNSHVHDGIWVQTEILSLHLQHRTSAAGVIGTQVLIPALGTGDYLLPTINNLALGAISGALHLRIKYGKEINQMRYGEERRVLFRGTGTPSGLQMNYYFETSDT